MKFQLMSITGIESAIASMKFTKRTWNPEWDATMRKNVQTVFDRNGFYIKDCEDQEAVEYVNAVDRDNVKVMLDTFHMNIEEDSFEDAIYTAGHHLGYLHVCENNRKLPGQGRLPWKEIGRALKGIEFQGPVVIESFLTMEGSVAHDLKIWRQLCTEGSEEEKAQNLKESVCFLKQVFN